LSLDGFYKTSPDFFQSITRGLSLASPRRKQGIKLLLGLVLFQPLKPVGFGAFWEFGEFV
jgi:hypothetical protein